MSTDYYRTLGVLDDAEDIVIKAAYKALAQRYHPDKWSGHTEEATRRMSDINEAYGVLSDPVKRKQYDKTRDKDSYQSEPEDDELSSSIKSDWDEVVQYMPDLIEISNNLRKISQSLEHSYKVLLLETKKFNDRQTLAQSIKRHFLERYFGTNEIILNYAENLILDGFKDAAKELNKAVNLLGSDIDPKIIIGRIEQKWSIAKTDKIRKLAKIVILNSSLFKSMDLIEMMGGSIEGPLNNKKFNVKRGATLQLDEKELIFYAKNLATEYLIKHP
jgi:curved DNA-binding protein CbpA